MPPKRKKKTKEPTITIQPAKKIEAPKTTVSDIEKEVRIRCIWDSRLIVGADKTISGRRYEFETGQEKPVSMQDYHFLLAMETRPYGCCGGTVRPQKFFEEV